MVDADTSPARPISRLGLRSLLGYVEFPRRFIFRAANYSRILAWLFRRSFAGRRRTLIIVTVQTLLYLFGQWAAIAIFYWYALLKQQEIPPAATEYFNFPLKEPYLLWAIIALSVLCFAGSSLFLFLSRSLVMKVVEQHYAHSLHQLLSYVKRLPDPRAPGASWLLARHGFGGLNGGCRLSALTAVHFCNVLAPVVGGMGALIVIFWIDPRLTLMLVIASGFWALLLYPLSLRAAKLAGQRERARAGFTMAARRLLGSPGEQVPENMASAHLLARAYLSRRRVSNEMSFLVQIGAILIAALAALYMASSILLGRGEWPIFIAYVGALRLALAGSFQAAMILASVSRFYPQISRFYLFMESAKELDKHSLGFLSAGDRISLGRLADGRDLVVKRGDRIAVATRDGPNQLRLAFLGARTHDGKKFLATAVIRPADYSSQHENLPIVMVDSRELVHTAVDELHSRVGGNVLLIAYEDPTSAGGFDERHILIVANGTLERFLTLGTTEANTVIQEWAVASSRRKVFPDSVDDDEDIDE